MEFFDNLPPTVALVLALLLFVWLLLLLLVPFMIESIRGWSRRTCQELEEMNRKLDVLTTLLGERAERGDARREPRVDPHADFDADPAPRVEPRAARYAESPEERGGRRRPERTRKEPTI